MTPKSLAVIQFPGSNCELETANSARYAGFQTDIVRWNCTPDQFDRYDAYILPGGFSYQDRVRAGVISSKLPILQLLKKANAQGKPILGICNGCQILSESGLVPDLSGTQQLEMALAPNQSGDTPIGFICDWVFVKIHRSSQSMFTRHLSDSIPIPIPINHGEGQFVFKPTVSERHLEDFTLLTYCTHDGDDSSDFPTNPNGSQWNIAGISNKKGNILAIMPHPERATFVKQVPAWIPGDWPHIKETASVDDGPWLPLFRSMFESVGGSL